MTLDTRTVVIVAVLSQAGFAAGMIFTAATQKVYDGFKYWTTFFVSLPIVFILLAARGVLPEIFTIILANALSLVSLIALHEGTNRFLGIEAKDSYKINMPIAVLAIAGITWFTYVTPALSARIAISSSAQFLICLHAGLRHYIGKQVRPKALQLMSIPLTGYSLFAATRGIRALNSNYSDVLKEGWTYDIFIMLVVLFSVLVMMGCLVMTFERALRETSQARRSLQTLLANLRGVAYRVRMNDENTIEYLSDGVEELSGYPRERFLGKSNSTFIEHVEPEDVKLAFEEIEASLKEKRPYSITIRYRHPTGQTYWLWDHGVGIKGDDGQFIYREGFISDITDRVIAAKENERLVKELKTALNEVKTLTGLIPICASCKKIRDDKGYWNNLEQYISARTNADFTHGICPDCAERLYPKPKDD